jgi:enoyl-CoA hydratase/carnithine racemase
MSNLIQEVISPGLLKITLNRPEAFNSLSEAVIKELHGTLQEVSNHSGHHSCSEREGVLRWA